MKVLAALSGGVDSAVAAALALKAGHQVTGIHLVLDQSVQTNSATNLPCATTDAAAAAKRLDISFDCWDLSAQFGQQVVQNFIDQYAAGRTPNPCIRCNQLIKFGALVKKALEAGFDAVCTGHYARLAVRANQVELRRSQYLAKDQSYVLAAAGAETLAHCLFPLGKASTKAEVRQMALDLGLDLATKPESLDICFVSDAGPHSFLRSHLGERPGLVLDLNGQVVGHHSGTYQFTVGQRRGLHLGTPARDGKPRYVVATDPAAAVVRVGPATSLDVDWFEVSDVTWLVPPPSTRTTATVQVRAHGQSHECLVAHHPSKTVVELAQPIRGLAAGQSAVFYHDDLVLGHGIIER
ncbi:MAG: tRNA 2-thiouridine(34) synthase MnmA [Micrococcales bacterium]|nr:tRNA 2-thiouridine(34) synthase MnmA [Micrococcales bacterium]